MIYIALLQLLGKEVEQKVVIRACLHIISHLNLISFMSHFNV